MIAILGDTHCNADFVLNAIQACVENGVGTIYQLGDFGYFPKDDRGQMFLQIINKSLQRNNIKLYWLGGNHDDYNDIEANEWRYANDFCMVRPNIFYIPDGHSWEVSGVKFVSVGGGTSIDKDYRIKGVSYFPQEFVSQRAVDRAIGNETADVLLTHECGKQPSDHQWNHRKADLSSDIVTMIDQDDRRIAEVRAQLKPQIQYHGHHHVGYTKISPEETMIVGMSWDGDPNEAMAIFSPTEMRFWRVKIY